MISIGIDISKDKSTICALKDGSEIIWKPFDLSHLEKDMNDFLSKLKTLSGEVRIIMEATGKYHLPVLYYLNSAGYFVSVINPLKMKQFCRSLSFRKAKNDQIDSKLIAEYGTNTVFLSIRNNEVYLFPSSSAACFKISFSISSCLTFFSNSLILFSSSLLLSSALNDLL